MGKSNAPVIETETAANESRVEDKRICFDDHEGEAEAAQPLWDQKNHDTNSVPTLLPKEKDDEVQLPTSEGVGHESIDMDAALTLTHKKKRTSVLNLTILQSQEKKLKIREQ